MIKSANQHPTHSLLSPQDKTTYRVPPYQREYSWQKPQWEDLFDDLMEAEGAHFLGTIITLDQSRDSLQEIILELIDGQQRMTTLTLLMAACYAILREHSDELDEDALLDMGNLKRQLVRTHGQETVTRVVPQRQGSNLDDYRAVLSKAGLLEAPWVNYMPLRRIDRCYEHFRREILDLAASQDLTEAQAAHRVWGAAQNALVVKIEVDSHADAFVLFESLNNRGMPLTPVDLIKNHVLAESERQKAMSVDNAFAKWNKILVNLGDNYANQERFLRHYYNAFRDELPPIPNASVATRGNLIRIYETLVGKDIQGFFAKVIDASEVYGRITSGDRDNAALSKSLVRLARAQGSPSYVLLLWLLIKHEKEDKYSEAELAAVVDLLTSFFVRRNLTGQPQTNALPRLFTSIIENIRSRPEDDLVGVVRSGLVAVSVSDDVFYQRLTGPVYEDNAEVARFLLTTLAEDAMTKENLQDLWRREDSRYVWTIEHILPQGEHLPQAWVDMLGGEEAAQSTQSEHVHRLGNLTITGFNSNLSNKSFDEKKNRKDSQGRHIGYLNGLSLNADVADREVWDAGEIEGRTERLARRLVARFGLGVS